jgi:hypothetical protein
MKKPGLKGVTPNDEKSSALYDDGAHDFLTDRFDPSTDSPNRFMVLAVGTVTEAGGHDEAGNRTTKYRLSHIEIPITKAHEDKMTALLKEIHRSRTKETTVPALEDPVPAETLDGMENVSDINGPKLKDDTL